MKTGPLILIATAIILLWIMYHNYKPHKKTNFIKAEPPVIVEKPTAQTKPLQIADADSRVVIIASAAEVPAVLNIQPIATRQV